MSQLVVRKARRDIQELALSYAESAVRTLAQIMRDPDETASDRIKAAEIILDRAYGKAGRASKNLIDPEDVNEAVDRRMTLNDMMKEARSRGIPIEVLR